MDRVIVTLNYSIRSATLARKVGNLPVRYARTNMTSFMELSILEKLLKKYKFNLPEEEASSSSSKRNGNDEIIALSEDDEEETAPPKKKKKKMQILEEKIVEEPFTQAY